MRTCYECKQRENMFNTSMQPYNCDEPTCEFYIPPPRATDRADMKETKTYAIFTKEENIITARAEALGKMVQTELSINDNNIKKNKKFDLEIKIKQYDVRILEIQKSLFNLETTRDDLKRELKSL